MKRDLFSFLKLKYLKVCSSIQAPINNQKVHEILKKSRTNLETVEQYRATFELAFNKNPEDIITDKGSKFLFPNPMPINVPPDLPGFYGWLDVDTLWYYQPGQELYPTKSSNYRGVFNVGRPITMQITNTRGQEYNIFFTSFWHNEVIKNEAPPFSSDLPDDNTVYSIKIHVPQLNDSDGYAFELELLDDRENFASFSIKPCETSDAQKVPVAKHSMWNFASEIQAQCVDIWHLKNTCKLRLTYQLSEVWCESF